jgi:hypothetical protein
LGVLQQQNLSDPQSLNSYSYSEDNPIIKEDPNGECPECVLALLGAGAGAGGQYAFDVGSNIETNGLNAGDFYTNLSSPQTYFTRAIQGAVIGATGGLAGTLTDAGIVGQSAIVGGASGVVGTAGNAYLGQPVTPQSVLFDSLIGGATFGFSELTPGVPGRLPNFGSSAFYAGAQTQEEALQLTVDALSNYLSSVLAAIATPQHAIIPTATTNVYSSLSPTISTGSSVSTPATSGSTASTLSANYHTACGTLCL